MASKDVNLELEKRVACLYRVSTMSQVEQDDIPMQKRACKEFIEKQHNWKIVKEYSEKGVSGYRVSASKRDELQRAKADAESGLYDVLLVFMFDRLGRREDETPFVVEWFTKQGVEVWSTQEGEQRFDTHVDKLMNYIRYWQSSGESQKTSMRVVEKHTQMVKDGLFRGGKPPYGYCLVKTGVINKKGKEISGLSIDTEESKIIKKMFDLIYLEGYGGGRIVKYLNEKGILSRTGKQWSLGVANYILRNPIYKGYMVYGKSSKQETGTAKKMDPADWILSDERIEELSIVKEEVWDKVQQIRKSRTPNMVSKKDSIDNYDMVKSHTVSGTTKSPLLFVGRITCGHCGSPLTTTYNYKTWTNKDGTVKKKLRVKYRCSGKALGKSCEGQTIYSQDKIETAVLDEVQVYLEELKKVDMGTQIDKFRKHNMDSDSITLKKLQKQIDSLNEELVALNKEVTKSIMGKSSFKPELIQSLIEEKNNEILDLDIKVAALNSLLKEKNVEVMEMQELQKHIPIWKELFDSVNTDRKKTMLNSVVQSVVVFKGYVEVEFKIVLKDFVTSSDSKGCETSTSALPAALIMHPLNKMMVGKKSRVTI